MSGHISFLNSSALSWKVDGYVLAGDDDIVPIVRSIIVSVCVHNGLPAVCVDVQWNVHGQKSDGSCCQVISHPSPPSQRPESITVI